MNIAIVSTSDIGGGAARAAYRLHRALVSARQKSEMFVSQKLTVDGTVRQVLPPLPTQVLTKVNGLRRRMKLARYKRPLGYEPFQCDHSVFQPFLIRALGSQM